MGIVEHEGQALLQLDPARIVAGPIAVAA